MFMVEWTTSDKDRIIEFIDNMMIKNPGISLVKCFKKSMNQLSQEKRMVIRSKQDIKAIIVELREMWIARKRDALNFKIMVVDKREVTPCEVLGRMSIIELKDYIARREEERYVDCPCVSKDTGILVLPKVNVPKFAVVGLLNNQFRVIEEYFKGYQVKLVHVDTSDDIVKARNFDKVFVMTKFTPHKWTYVSNRELIGGGLSQLIVRMIQCLG